MKRSAPLIARSLASLALLAFATGIISNAQEKVGISEITPQCLVFRTSAGNVVASVGADGAVLIGIPSAESTSEISKVLASRTKSPVRYVVIAAEDPSQSEGDAGWGRRGAFVAMQENALQRIGGHVMGPPQPLPERFVKLQVDRPRIAFSEVLTFDLNGEAIHTVRQTPGYSDADVLAHFHAAKLVYFGETFPGDGYPRIDPQQGGTLAGLLKTLGGWTDSNFHVVPARGKVVTGAEVKTFVDMITVVRDRVQEMVKSGLTEDQIVAKHPTAEFDNTFGHGRVQPEVFVREVYASLAGH